LLYSEGDALLRHPIRLLGLLSRRKERKLGGFYFLPRFGCGARCESADAATFRTGLLVLCVRSTRDATFATPALVLRLLAIVITL
jgi:hypothetical protein